MRTIFALLRLLVGCAPLLLAAQARAQLQGTLFTDPEEREYLDYLREEFRRRNADQGFDIEEVEIPQIPSDQPEPDTGPTTYSFDGVMTTRESRRVIWLDGRMLAEDALPEGFSLVGGEQAVSLRIARDDKIFQLRPGQTVNLITGSVAEKILQPAPESAQPAAVEVPAAGADDALDQSAAETPADSEEANISSGIAATPDSALAEETLPNSPDAPDNADRASRIAEALAELNPEEADDLLEAVRQIQERESEADDAP